MSEFATIDEAIDDIREGRIVIVVDDEERENEGDFVMAAEKVTPEAINFMATHGRGIICMPATRERLEELRIPLMVSQEPGSPETAFTVTIDANGVTTTGTSAHDRAATIKRVCDSDAGPGDFRMPGHVFPLRAQPGGVLKRAGHTEAAVDLARLAGLAPCAVICEVLNDDGTIARGPDLERLAADHDLARVTIEDLVAYRRSTLRPGVRVPVVT